MQSYDFSGYHQNNSEKKLTKPYIFNIYLHKTGKNRVFLPKKKVSLHYFMPFVQRDLKRIYRHCNARLCV